MYSITGGNLGMKYISTSEAAEKWNLSKRRIIVLCNEGRIEGAQKAGSTWIIPDSSEKPNDARIKTGKYIKLSNNARGENE